MKKSIYLFVVIVVALIGYLSSAEACPPGQTQIAAECVNVGPPNDRAFFGNPGDFQAHCQTLCDRLIGGDAHCHGRPTDGFCEDEGFEMWECCANER